MKYEQIRNLLDEPFRRLTGIKRQTFEKMVKILEEDDKNKKIKGGRKNKLSLENQLLMSDRYRNRRKRFGLRFNLIAGIYNFEVGKNDGNISEGQRPCPGS